MLSKHLSEVLLPPKTPELDRVGVYREDSQKIGSFLEWLQEKYSDEEVAHLPSIDDLLHEYFELDAEKCEMERREILAYQRLLNSWTDIRKELGLDDEE